MVRLKCIIASNGHLLITSEFYYRFFVRIISSVPFCPVISAPVCFQSSALLCSNSAAKKLHSRIYVRRRFVVVIHVFFALSVTQTTIRNHVALCLQRQRIIIAGRSPVDSHITIRRCNEVVEISTNEHAATL